MRVAVVGHVEWMEFAVVERVPVAGEIVHAGEAFHEPGGGGAVAAVQLAKLAGEATLYTALGDDELGRRVEARLSELGVRVCAVFRPEAQRHGFVHLDARAERTITVIGPRLGASADNPLPWHELDSTDAVYFTAGDAGAVRQARRAGTLVSTTRALDSLAEAAVELDALASSRNDVSERYEEGALVPTPRLVLRSEGAAGGSYLTADGREGRWEPEPPPGPPRDAYGCGDSFAAGVTYGLGAGLGTEEALRLGARCGAACLTGRGPFEGQLREARAA
jgi:ribokinase